MMKRVLAMMMVFVMIIPVVSAGNIDGPTRFLLGTSGYTQEIEEISLTIMALSSASDDLSWNIEPQLENIVETLLSQQNPDGGWGYYFGSASNVLDTSYAVIALQRAYNAVDPDMRGEIEAATKRGVEYIRNSAEDKGWGYIKGTDESCYPTVVSLWALGESGYSIHDKLVKNAVAYIQNVTSCEIPDNEFLALKAIALHSVGYPIDEATVDTIKNILLNGDPLPKERAMLSYALVLVSAADFDTMRALLILREEGQSAANSMFWSNPTYMLSSTESIASTAYALMAFSEPMKRAPTGEPVNPYRMPCESLEKLQNPDGGWGLTSNAPSNEKATYYSLLAMEKCYPPNETIQMALNWTKGAIKRDAAWMVANQRMSVEYFYALETLLRYGLLNQTEKDEAVQLIEGVQIYGGLWGSTVHGPQPYETALAVKALLDLGVPATDPLIQRAKEWLLGISHGGWGTYVATSHFAYMLKPDVLTTITVIEALEGIATPEELEPHLQWLAEQRVGNGWAYWKEYYDPDRNKVVSGEPSVELTVRATDLLTRYGYNYTYETLEFVINARDSGMIDKKPIELANAVLYLCRFQYILPVTLYDVRNALDGGSFTVIARGIDNESTNKILSILNELFSASFTLSNSTEIGEGNYIVIAPYGSYSLAPRNPYMAFHVDNGTLTVDNVTVPTDKAVAVVPGKTAGGVVLFVFYEPGNEWIVRDFFTTGYLDYIWGSAMVLVKESGKVRVIAVG
jgi:hypothetical protein